MTYTDALVVTQEDQLLREIGAILDHPSLYMGGASRQSLMKARAILPIIERTRIEGVKAGLEAAARVADEHRRAAWDIANKQGQNELVASGRNHAGREIGDAIRALDPAAIAAIGVDGEVG